jgi:hypothetical protein
MVVPRASTPTNSLGAGDSSATATPVGDADGRPPATLFSYWVTTALQEEDHGYSYRVVGLDG